MNSFKNKRVHLPINFKGQNYFNSKTRHRCYKKWNCGLKYFWLWMKNSTKFYFSSHILRRWLFLLSCFFQFFANQWIAQCKSSLSITISLSLIKLISIELVMPSKHLILCHPLLHLTSFFLASGSFQVNQVFLSVGQSIGASASKEYSGLISFRIDWFDPLFVQGESQESSPAP